MIKSTKETNKSIKEAGRSIREVGRSKLRGVKSKHALIISIKKVSKSILNVYFVAKIKSNIYLIIFEQLTKPKPKCLKQNTIYNVL